MGYLRLRRSARQGRTSSGGWIDREPSQFDEIVRLQHEAGNKAVSGALVQRDKKAVTKTLVFPSLDQLVPLESFHFVPSWKIAASRSESENSQEGEVSAIFPSSAAASSSLMQTVAKGQHLPEVRISTHAGTWILKDVIPTSFRSTGSGDEPLDSIDLSFKEVEFKGLR